MHSFEMKFILVGILLTMNGFIYCQDVTCGDISLQRNILMSASGKRPYKVGAQMTFRCQNGFRSIGRMRIRCQPNGHWSGPVPACQDVSRDPCHRVSNRVEADRICQPSCERQKCSTSTQCYCDGWCGKSCVDPGSLCPPITQPENGDFKGNNRTYGSEIIFTCDEGFKMVGNSKFKCRSDNKWSDNAPKCADIDECEHQPCDQKAACWNSLGSYECECDEGYIGNGKVCADIEECASDPRPCHADATCWNSLGSYSCECNEGYTGDGIFCQAMGCRPPEFENGRFYPRRKQYNFEDEIMYICDPGFKLNGSTSAVCDSSTMEFQKTFCIAPKKECLAPPEVVNGRYYPIRKKYNIGDRIMYSCNTGYKVDGKSVVKCESTMQFEIPSCVDINECDMKYKTCDQNAVCVNSVGSYTCKCESGFIGNGKSCRDINECDRKYKTCDQNAVCVNSVGSYTCKCESGFIGNGKSCRDTDNCSDEVNPCHADAVCTNTAGGYECVCLAGFTGDGKICRDMDECASGSVVCHIHASCANTPGSYQCSCNAGYVDDGMTCSASSKWSQWGPWGPWEQCSVSCGVGTVTRRRGCYWRGFSVSPQYCGNVDGDNEKWTCTMRQCQLQPYLPDPSYQPGYTWSDWLNEGPCYDRSTGSCKRSRKFARTCTVLKKNQNEVSLVVGGGCLYFQREEKTESCTTYECDMSRDIMNRAWNAPNFGFP